MGCTQLMGLYTCIEMSRISVMDENRLLKSCAEFIQYGLLFSVIAEYHIYCNCITPYPQPCFLAIYCNPGLICSYPLAFLQLTLDSFIAFKTFLMERP